MPGNTRANAFVSGRWGTDMPRIYTSASDPVDFHAECFPTEGDAEEQFGNVGDGPDGRGNCFAYDAEHPDYEEMGYDCHRCGEPLTSQD